MPTKQGPASQALDRNPLALHRSAGIYTVFPLLGEQLPWIYVGGRPDMVKGSSLEHIPKLIFGLQKSRVKASL
jgi:hypothetical protein